MLNKSAELIGGRLRAMGCRFAHSLILLSGDSRQKAQKATCFSSTSSSGGRDAPCGGASPFTARFSRRGWGAVGCCRLQAGRQLNKAGSEGGTCCIGRVFSQTGPLTGTGHSRLTSLLPLHPKNSTTLDILVTAFPHLNVWNTCSMQVSVKTIPATLIWHQLTSCVFGVCSFNIF